MLVIRLARTGRTKYPTYRIVAADSARAATGRFVAQLGHYNPHTKELVVKHDETLQYLANGAQPSNSVIKLLTRDGVELPKWAKLKTKVAKVEPAGEASVEAAEAETVVEAAIEEEVEIAPVAEAEAPAEEERVATVAEDEAVEKSDATDSMATQETAASEEVQAEAAKEA